MRVVDDDAVRCGRAETQRDATPTYSICRMCLSSRGGVSGAFNVTHADNQELGAPRPRDYSYDYTSVFYVRVHVLYIVSCSMAS